MAIIRALLTFLLALSAIASIASWVASLGALAKEERARSVRLRKIALASSVVLISSAAVVLLQFHSLSPEPRNEIPDPYTSSTNTSNREGRPPETAPAVHPCIAHTIFIEPLQSANRTVLLVNGQAHHLVERYKLDAEERSITIDWSNLRVLCFVEPSQLKRFDMPIRSEDELRYGLHKINTWRRGLREVTALPIPSPDAIARQLGSDLLCGDGS